MIRNDEYSWIPNEDIIYSGVDTTRQLGRTILAGGIRETKMRNSGDIDEGHVGGRRRHRRRRDNV